MYYIATISKKVNGSNIRTAWDLYDRDTVQQLISDNPQLLPTPTVDIPKAQQWNQQHLSNTITQGILQGESIPNIAKRLESVVGMDYNSAIRIARTATTCAQNSGRISSYRRAESIGIQMEKEWLATLDNRTRHEHRQLDGQRVGVDEPFKIDGFEIEFPADPKAPAYLVYNCRCTLVAAIKGHDQSDAPRASKLGNMSYDEWKNDRNNAVINRIPVVSSSAIVSTRNSSVGNPAAVYAGNKLSKRQTELLSYLSKDGDFVTVPKRKCSMKDLASLTAHEGVEFAMLTRKGERMIFRGSERTVSSINGITAVEFAKSGWKWSGHTHAVGGVVPSDGDEKILELFGQTLSCIYDYKGNMGMVELE